MHNPQPLLSIGMIVKNETRCLKRCLEALSPLRQAIPCELVIADTGSTDDTKEIAEKYADILFDFAWCDDFSAARNAVIERCTGKWCLTIDADEYLDKNFEELTDFLKSPHSDSYKYAYLTIRNYSTLAMEADSFRDFFAIRLHRISKEVRYEGMIHEALPWQETDPVFYLENVFLHHDGYALQQNSDEKKARRNLPLLEKELKKDPKNLLRVLQCLESSYTKEQAKKYASLGVELVQTLPHHAHWKLLGPAVLREAVSKAVEYDFSECKEWTAFARETYPDSIHTLVDIPFSCMIHAMNHEDSERCLEEGKAYFKGLERLRKKSFDRKELQTGGAKQVRQIHVENAYFMQAVSYCRLERWESSLEALKKVPLTGNDENRIANFTRLLFQLWQNSDLELRPLFLQEWEKLENAEDTEENEKRRELFRSLCNNALGSSEKTARPISGLFAVLGEGNALGRVSLLLESDSSADIEKFLTDITDWKDVPPIVLKKALERGITFPPQFYRSFPEIMEQLSKGLAKLYAKNPKTLLSLHPKKTSVDPGQKMWHFLLINDMMEYFDWNSDAETDDLLDTYFVQIELYLHTFYTPVLCQEENIHLLPARVRFGWYCLNAQKALQQDDTKEAVRLLRAALHTFPRQKEMISFLLESVKKKTEAPKTPQPQPQAVSAELLALAQQIRTILSRFAPDDPAVLQLKASPAYQMVAHLIDPMDAKHNIQ